MGVAARRVLKSFKALQIRACASGQEPKLSREWIREIERRVRDSDNPVRYMLVSEYSRSFILYYNVSDDMFAMNAPERGTLFKRRKAAENVSSLLSRGIRIVKFATKGGRLKRISPFKGPAWAKKKLSSRSRKRMRSPTALP
jgi:hypothetical protein